MQPEAGPRYTGRGMAVARRRNRPIELHVVLTILVVLLLVYEAHKHPHR